MALGSSAAQAVLMDLFSDTLTWRDSDVMFPGMQQYSLISDDHNKLSVQDLDQTVLGDGDLNSIYQTAHRYESGPKDWERLFTSRAKSSLATSYSNKNDEGGVGRTSPSVIANTFSSNLQQHEDIDHDQLFSEYHVPSHMIAAQEDVTAVVSSLGCNNPGAQITDKVENPHELCGSLPYDPAFEESYAIEFGSSFSPMDMLVCPDGSPAKTAIQTHTLYPNLVSAHIDCYKIGAEPADLKSMEEACLKHQHLQPKNNVGPSTDTKEELDSIMAWYLRVLVDLKEKVEEPFFAEKEWCNEIFENLKLLGPSSSPSEMTGTGQTHPGETEGYTSIIGETMQQSNVSSFDLENGFIIEPTNQDRLLKEWLRSKHDRSQIYHLRGQCKKKRRQGKHSQTAREQLVEWFTLHGEWPYPSEEEKLQLAKQTNLEPRQINNWFINQRKRHWDSLVKEDTNRQVRHELRSDRKIANQEKVLINKFYAPLDLFDPPHTTSYS